MSREAMAAARNFDEAGQRPGEYRPREVALTISTATAQLTRVGSDLTEIDRELRRVARHPERYLAFPDDLDSLGDRERRDRPVTIENGESWVTCLSIFPAPVRRRSSLTITPVQWN